MKPVTLPQPASRLSAFTGWVRSRQLSLQADALAASVYAALILIMWGAYNIFSGFPYETGLIYSSEVHPGLLGFYYLGDRLRLYESNFYHLGYLLGEMLHIGGSYVPYQVVYAGLWWARGFLVFLLIRRFLPGRVMLAYVAGALVLVHASDGALQWVGQMNQVGVIFWTLAAFLALTMALETRWQFSILWIVLAALLEHRALWSYESEILLILLFPLLLILHPRRRGGKLAALAALWYVVPAIYIRLTIVRYLSTQNSYQQSVARKVWTPVSIASDWWFNIASSLEFWKWSRGSWKGSIVSAELLSLLVAILFLTGGMVLMRLANDAKGKTPELEFRPLSYLLSGGLALLVLSFPVYLILESARGLWRTQMLSGIGAGTVLAGLAGFAAMAVWRPAWRTTALLFLASIMTFEGSLAAIQRGAYHRFIWERHRTAIREVLEVAPDVQSGTVVVLTGVPKPDDDPFGDDLWFDFALRLIYPNRYVSGIYFYSNGAPAPGNNIAMRGGEWIWNGNGMAPLVQKASVAQSIVVCYAPSGEGRVEKAFPEAICAPDCSAAGQYDPEKMITGPISQRTLRRYNLEPGFARNPNRPD